MIRRPSFLGVFSVFIFAGMFATDAFATHVCPRCYHATITSTGSELSLEVQVGDSTLTVQNEPGTSDFFSVIANTVTQTPEGQIDQFVNCTYDPDPLDTTPGTATTCSISFTCNLFKRGDCIVPSKPGSLGQRQSTMTCDTPAVGQTLPGCRGVIEVWGPGFPGVLSNRLAQVPIGDDLNGIVGPGCKNDFPRLRDPSLAMGVMGTMLSVCSASTDTDVTDDPISQIAVRTDLRDDGSKRPEFLATGGVTEGVHGGCDTTTGFPATSCGPSAGQVHVTVLDPDGTTVDAKACAAAASALACGQRPDGSFGPQPATCTQDNNGLCKCRCDKCDAGVPLVNSAVLGVGQFALSDPLGLTGVGKKPWSAICSPVQTN